MADALHLSATLYSTSAKRCGGAGAANLTQPGMPSIPHALLLTLLLTCTACTGQQSTTPQPTVYPTLPVTEVMASLDQYQEASLKDRRFKLSDLLPLIESLPASFRVDTAGYSVMRQPVHRITYGRGTTTVLLWSQMHGDEPTATAALFDLFLWLQGQGDGLDSVRTAITEGLQLTFLPMLNPDGAARYERRNALGIDLNRDALHLTSPESRLLKDERDRLDAQWGFNLHDQGVYYSAGFPATKGCVLSILAPAYDWEKTMGPGRRDAAQVIALMNDLWQREVPGQVGRYNDDFEPRAFGDNLQKWGTRTILIESGGYPGDPEKQEIRRLNLLGLIGGLYGIATGGYAAHPLDDYWAIPENQSNGMHEVILENAAVEFADTTYVLDIGLRISETNTGPQLRHRVRSAYVSDLGDLHTYGAFTRLNVAGKRIAAGGVYPGKLSLAEALALDPVTLYTEGYTAVRIDARQSTPPEVPGLRVFTGGGGLDDQIEFGRRLDLLVYGDGSTPEAAIVNGEMFQLR